MADRFWPNAANRAIKVAQFNKLRHYRATSLYKPLTQPPDLARRTVQHQSALVKQHQAGLAGEVSLGGGDVGFVARAGYRHLRLEAENKVASGV